MLIKNVKVFKEDKTFEDGEIVIRDGLISGERKDGGEVIDGEDCYAIPGLIDIHFHGCKGYDFCDGTKEAIHEIAKYEASIGVTAISPATMTLPVEQLEEILATAAAYKKEAADEADLIGVNMEGPFISKEKKRSPGRHIYYPVYERNISPVPERSPGACQIYRRGAGKGRRAGICRAGEG